jgi:Tfp pilus assembly protein PilN
MKFRLNLSTTPQRNNRPFLAGAALLGTLGLIALAVLSLSAYKSWQANRAMRADIAHWQQEILADRQRQQNLEMYFQSPTAQRILDRAGFLNSLIDERSFPWTKIFMDLERTLPPGVRVVSISPKLVNGRAQVQLEVGAASDDGKIQFLEAIEKSKVFSGMQVTQERRTDTAGSTDKVMLDLSVWYSTT